MNRPTASNNLSRKTENELKETVKRFMCEASNNLQLLRDKLTGAGFKDVQITTKADGRPWVVTALASGKKVAVWQ